MPNKKTSFVVLGVDPGTRRIGYGLVASGADRKLRFMEAGLVDTKSQEEGPALVEAERHLVSIIKKHRPEAVVIERLFFAKNQKTGIQVAQARGVILLVAARSGLRIIELAPSEMKMAIAGSGNADKVAVLKMVRLFLGEPGLSVIDDASDALALAIAGVHQIDLDKRRE